MHAQLRGGSIYTSTARFDGTARALTEDELRQNVPSLFATEAHESRSAKFAVIPTWEVAKGLQAEGFSIVGAKQSVTRDPGKAPYTKHLLRLRRLDDGVKHTVNGTVFEMLLRNANDGSSRYELMAALWRILCSNSLVALSDELSSIKIRHSGNVRDDVIEGSYRVLGEAEAALAAPEEWSKIRLEPEEKALLAQAAHVVRFGETPEGEPPAIEPKQLLIPHRPGDYGQDLWTVGNVIQENVVKGGLTGWTRDANNNPRRTTTRAIKSIDTDVKVNKALWLINQHFANAKTGAAVAA